jgi:hypothetical protein
MRSGAAERVNRRWRRCGGSGRGRRDAGNLRRCSGRGLRLRTLGSYSRSCWVGALPWVGGPGAAAS